MSTKYVKVAGGSESVVRWDATGQSSTAAPAPGERVRTCAADARHGVVVAVRAGPRRPPARRTPERADGAEWESLTGPGRASPRRAVTGGCAYARARRRTRPSTGTGCVFPAFGSRPAVYGRCRGRAAQLVERDEPVDALARAGAGDVARGAAQAVQSGGAAAVADRQQRGRGGALGGIRLGGRGAPGPAVGVLAE